MHRKRAPLVIGSLLAGALLAGCGAPASHHPQTSRGTGTSPAGKLCTITVILPLVGSYEGGTVTIAPAAGQGAPVIETISGEQDSVRCGQQYSLTETPNPLRAMTFSGWSLTGDGGSYANTALSQPEITVPIRRNLTVTANFAN